MVDVSKVEGIETIGKEFSDLTHIRGSFHEGKHSRRVLALQLFEACLRRNDLGTLDQLVTVAMIAVRMCVDEHVNRLRRTRLGGRHGFQHVAGERLVEKRVDDERLVSIHDQTGVAPPPSAVGLQPGVAAVA